VNRRLRLLMTGRDVDSVHDVLEPSNADLRHLDCV
jgi:hypothetical protein